jgi:hypothetical protein
LGEAGEGGGWEGRGQKGERHTHDDSLTHARKPHPTTPPSLPLRSRLVLSRFGRVAEVSYVGSDAVEGGNLAALVGYSASYLNGLERRVAADKLPDLIAFLRADWASALYHDRFGELLTALRGALAADDARVGALAAQAEALLRAADDGADAAGEGKEGEVTDGAAAVMALRKEGVGVAGGALPAETRRAVERRVLAFLQANSQILPAYLVPALGMA